LGLHRTVHVHPIHPRGAWISMIVFMVYRDQAVLAPCLALRVIN